MQFHFIPKSLTGVVEIEETDFDVLILKENEKTKITMCNIGLMESSENMEIGKCNLGLVNKLLSMEIRFKLF